MIRTIIDTRGALDPTNDTPWYFQEVEPILCRDQPDSCWDCTNEVSERGEVCEECRKYCEEHA